MRRYRFSLTIPHAVIGAGTRDKDHRLAFSLFLIGEVDAVHARLSGLRRGGLRQRIFKQEDACSYDQTAHVLPPWAPRSWRKRSSLYGTQDGHIRDTLRQSSVTRLWPALQSP